MRIAVNALAVGAQRYGGDATYVRKLVELLPKIAPNDEWFAFVLPQVRATLPSPPANVRYIWCAIPTNSLVIRALWEQLVLPRLVRRQRPDVLHAPVNVAPLITEVPIVLTLLEAEPFMPNSGIPAPLLGWWRFARTSSARRARRILTISEAARTDITHWMSIPRERIEMIHLGVDRDRFFPGNVRSTERLPSRPYVFWLGRTYPRKNVSRLIAAFSRLAERFEELVLVLAGTPSWDDAGVTRTIALSGVSDRVVRTTIASEVADWYRGARLFAFPSLHESFGLPVVEAMACGTPVVAADIPGLREIAGSAAEYVDPCDIQDIERGLNRTLSSSDRREAMRSAGLARAAAFRWEDTARRTYAVYQEVLSAQQSGQPRA